MDDFPFPFYVILRQIAALPAIIGEALLQWFEIVIAESWFLFVCFVWFFDEKWKINENEKFY